MFKLITLLIILQIYVCAQPGELFYSAFGIINNNYINRTQTFLNFDNSCKIQFDSLVQTENSYKEQYHIEVKAEVLNFFKIKKSYHIFEIDSLNFEYIGTVDSIRATYNIYLDRFYFEFSSAQKTHLSKFYVIVSDTNLIRNNLTFCTLKSINNQEAAQHIEKYFYNDPLSLANQLNLDFLLASDKIDKDSLFTLPMKELFTISSFSILNNETDLNTIFVGKNKIDQDTGFWGTNLKSEDRIILNIHSDLLGVFKINNSVNFVYKLYVPHSGTFEFIVEKLKNNELIKIFEEGFVF